MKMLFVQVSHKSTGFGLAWLGIARSIQSVHETYIQKADMVKFSVYIESP